MTVLMTIDGNDKKKKKKKRRQTIYRLLEWTKQPRLLNDLADLVLYKADFFIHEILNFLHYQSVSIKLTY